MLYIEYRKIIFYSYIIYIAKIYNHSLTGIAEMIFLTKDIPRKMSHN